MIKPRYIACMAAISAMLASCVTTTKTAKTADIEATTYNATVADLDVAEQRVSVTLNPVPDDVRRGGMSNIKKTVEAMALEQSGNADLLVNPEFTYTVERGFLSSKVTSMTVTGRPARYKNFRSLNDSVWSNPVFRGTAHKTRGIGKVSKAASFAGKLGRIVSGSMISVSGGKSDSYGFSDGGQRKGFDVILDLAPAYDFDVEQFSPSGGVTFGYNIMPILYVGVGATYNLNVKYKAGSLPIYGNARLYLAESKSAPFVDLRIGRAVDLHGDNANDYYYGYHEKKSEYESGMYYSVALGYRFSSVDFSIYYTRQPYVHNWDYYYSEDRTAQKLGLRIGFHL